MLARPLALWLMPLPRLASACRHGPAPNGGCWLEPEQLSPCCRRWRFIATDQRRWAHAIGRGSRLEPHGCCPKASFHQCHAKRRWVGTALAKESLDACEAH